MEAKCEIMRDPDYWSKVMINRSCFKKTHRKIIYFTQIVVDVIASMLINVCDSKKKYLERLKNAHSYHGMELQHFVVKKFLYGTQLAMK